MIENIPLLSIITINLNNSRGLKETLNSVSNQIWVNFEHVVIDGGSTDESVDVLKSFNYPNLSWISERDSGIYNAMNKGINKASGEYLLFLNSGDVFSSSNALNEFIGNDDFNGDVIYGDYEFELGQKIYPDELSPLFFIKSSLPHQSTFIKKSIFMKCGLYDESFKICGDRDFFINVFLKDEYIFKHLNYKLVKFDLGGISNSQEHEYIKKEEDHRIFKNHFGIFYEDYMNYIALERKYNTMNTKLSTKVLKKIKRFLK